MADSVFAVAPHVIGALLVAGGIRQFIPIDRIGVLLDRVAIVPQWRFYAQRQIGSHEAVFDDLHLIARTRTPGGHPGAWRPLLGPGERAPSVAVWHPRQRSNEQLTEFMQALCPAGGSGKAPPGVGSIAYLAVLRFALQTVEPAAGELIQFAIVSTRGRGARAINVMLLSEWHRP